MYVYVKEEGEVMNVSIIQGHSMMEIELNIHSTYLLLALCQQIVSHSCDVHTAWRIRFPLFTAVKVQIFVLKVKKVISHSVFLVVVLMIKFDLYFKAEGNFPPFFAPLT